MAWRFKDFLDRSGQNVIRPWLDGLPVKACVKINGRLRHLAAEAHLKPPFVKKIVGFEKIFEARVVSHKVQYRPLGFFGPGTSEFTFVLGAIEKGSIEPANAFATAETRRKAVLSGQNKVADHEYDS